MAYRLSGWDRPFWVNPNRSAGRYNRPGSHPTQYWCLDPQGPWAEFLRRDDRRTHEELDQLRGSIWVMRLEVPSHPLEVLLENTGETERVLGYVDLTFDRAVLYGLSAKDLVSDDYSACQDFAERCLGDPNGPRILCVPNAALPGTRNLVIFGERLAVPYEATTWDPAIDVRSAMVADRAKPPPDVLARVRFSGE